MMNKPDIKSGTTMTKKPDMESGTTVTEKPDMIESGTTMTKKPDMKAAEFSRPVDPAFESKIFIASYVPPARTRQSLTPLFNVEKWGHFFNRKSAGTDPATAFRVLREMEEEDRRDNEQIERDEQQGLIFSCPTCGRSFENRFILKDHRAFSAMDGVCPRGT